MQKLFGCVAMAAVLVAPATGAEAGELSLTIANGRVTLIAHDVTVRQILDEWARVGQTRIVNGDKLLGAPMTIELRDVTEAKALETVLRSAAGYLVAPRMAGATGTSFYDRILILPTSRPPAVTSAPPAQFNRFPPQPQPQPQPMPVVDDDEPAPGSVPPGMPQAGQPFPGAAPMPSQPGAQQPVNTLPRPGMLPPAPSGPANPYQPQPGVRPPGAPGGPGGGGTPVTRRGPGGGGSEGGI